MVGKTVTQLRTPADAIRAGVVYLTEDRKAQGLFLDMSVADNINVCACVPDAHAGGVLNRRHAAQRSQDAIKSLSIRVASGKVNVGALSGGNQQKVLLARLLEVKPHVLILDEPTRGVDIGSKSEIYRIINQLAQAGVGVVVISSELPEIIGTCDRVLIMREGQLVAEVGGASGHVISQERIIDLATGAIRWLPMADSNNTMTLPPIGKAERLRELMRSVGMLPVLVLLLVGFALASENFLTVQNLSIITQQASVNVVLAAGMTFVILTAGIDLSVGAILAASAVVALQASMSPQFGMFGIAAGIGFGLLLGLVNGGLIAFMRLPPFIVTLGALTAMRGLARLLADDKTVFNPDLPFAFIGNDSILGVPWLVVIAVAVVALSWFILRRTVMGVQIYSVGGNPEAARLSGIKVWKVLLFVYAMSGALAGLGAVMSASRLFAANGLQLGQSYELDAIAAVILGGTSFTGGVGTIGGTLIGALIIAVLTNGLVLLGVSDIWQYIIKGIVIIGAVALDRYRQSGART